VILAKTLRGFDLTARFSAIRAKVLYQDQDKIAKTTPCKVEWTPARGALASLRPGQEKKKAPT
jgi:hypothetical protein